MTDGKGFFMSKPAVLALAAVVLIISNTAAFLLMKRDKQSAQKGKWRVKEKTLFIAAACFGALGGVLGMQLLRHKTQHWYFRLFFPLMLLVQLALLVVGAVRLFS